MDFIDSHDWSNWEYVIIGGGIAGLAAANRLADIGHRPLVIEAGSYPSHKVCGEFISPEAMPILDEWELVPPVEIDTILLHAGNCTHTYQLRHPAGAMSRYELDLQLVERARNRGACVRTETRVVALRPGNPHRIRLSTGERIAAKHLLVSTGRLAGAEESHRPYMGFKRHFEGIEMERALELFSLPGAYVGMTPLGDGSVNVAALVSAKWSKESPEAIMRGVLERCGAKRLSEQITGARPLFTEWLAASVPPFGPRLTPSWPNGYFVGDAAGTIAPASGDGIAMAITSGWLAAEYASAGDAKGFRWAWGREYQARLRWAGRWQTIVMQPWATKLAIQSAKRLPPLADWLFHKTRS